MMNKNKKSIGLYLTLVDYGVWVCADADNRGDKFYSHSSKCFF